jgi:MarR family transcriptional regulator, lower aerobic nicotinate degradation pathway regulator
LRNSSDARAVQPRKGRIDTIRTFSILPIFNAARPLPPNPDHAMDDLHSMPGHLIRRAQQISSALFAEECGEFDLTSVQYAALVAIKENPDVDATRLSTLIAFDRSTIGDVLTRLEAKGWAVRHHSGSDKRVKLLRLSPEGAKVLRRVEPAVRRVQKRLLAPLAPDDRLTLVRLLARLTDAYNDILPVPLSSRPAKAEGGSS